MVRKIKVWLILSLCFFFISGCAFELKQMRIDIENYEKQRKNFEPAFEKLGLKDYKGVIHVHTSLSRDSQGKIEEIVEAAKKNKIDFVILTDHNGPEVIAKEPQGMIDGILFIKGVEIIKDKTDILAISPNEYIDKGRFDWPEITQKLREQNALIAIAHADYLYRNFDIKDYDAIEIYDIFDDVLTERVWKWPGHLWRIICCWEKYKEEIFLKILDRPDYALKKWTDNLKYPPIADKHIAAISGNDSHQNVKIFKRQLDPYWLSFKMTSTHIIAEEFSKTAILKALKMGRTYISFDIAGGGSNQFEFYAIAGENQQKLLLMGDEIEFQDYIYLVARLNGAGKIKLFRNQKIILEKIGNSLIFTADGPGIYRVEAERKIGSKWYPLIISNPIYIKPSLN